MKKIISIYLLVLLFLSGCSAPTPSCRYGMPKPIFKADNKRIAAHQFEQKGQQASEEVQFDNGMELKVLQSGCDNIKQVFRFKLREDLTAMPSDFFTEKAVEQFRFLGTLSDDHLSFGQIAGLITDKKATIKLGQSFSLEENYFMIIDRVLGKNDGILMITLSNTNLN